MTAGLPQAAYAAALAGFDRMTVARLLALLRTLEPEHAYRVATGASPAPRGTIVEQVMSSAELRSTWADESARRTVAATWERCRRLGLDVSYVGTAEHPSLLADDPMPPAVLFTRGDRALLNGRRVALVGTRNATQTGRYVAERFGAGLAGAGVHVVSGLARGVDGAAHRGALAAVAGADGPSSGRPIAVVACGLDVVYPREHRRLWDEIGQVGLLVSEWPPGVAPVAYRFPLRNRIIAALSEIVVVVESRETGGSLITAAQATERGVPVMAVPGNTLERTSLGVNSLLRDGSAPVIDIDDILVALALDHTRSGAVEAEQRPRPSGADLAVYRLVAARPVTIGDVATSLGVDLVDAAMSLARLHQTGWLAEVDGWFETLGSPLR